MKKTAVLLSMLLPSSFSWARCEGFLPPNKHYLPESVKEGLSLEQYNEVIDKIEKVYLPVALEHGAKLVIKREWKSGIVNAGTSRNDIKARWTINLYGGMARHQRMTQDAYALVICHELGHHLGGAPKKTLSQKVQWASSEGQADYWATLKCFRRVFESEDNEALIQSAQVPEIVSSQCEEHHPLPKEAALCKRIALASKAIASVSADMRNSRKMPLFSTPDDSMVSRTFHSHPKPQCRLDTYFQGALCPVAWNVPVSQYNERDGVCLFEMGHIYGVRPLCWHKPKK